MITTKIYLVYIMCQHINFLNVSSEEAEGEMQKNPQTKKNHTCPKSNKGANLNFELRQSGSTPCV